MLLPKKYVTNFSWRERASEQIANAMREAILLCDLDPGQAISESGIAETFEVSRAPVREAFFKLKIETLIVTYRSRGTFVSKLSENSVKGALFVREAIELSIVEHLCQHGLSDTKARDLEALAGHLSSGEEPDAGSLYSAPHKDFHVSLARASKLDRVTEVIKREKGVCDRFFRYQEMLGYPRNPPKHYAAILELLRTKDACGAQKVMRDHLHDLACNVAIPSRADLGHFAVQSDCVD